MNHRIPIEGLLNRKGKRLLALAEALQTGGTMSELAEMTGSSLRNVYRDIVHLRGMGLNIIRKKARYVIACLVLASLTGCASYHDVTHSEQYGRWKRDQQHNLQRF